MDDDDFYPPESVISRVKSILLSKGKKCVGCTKTLCYDLIHDQTFEAFDPSSDPNYTSTLSESSLGYTKQFWKDQKYNDSDVNGECLNFIKGRHSEIITIPYIFVVTQFSHSSNTIQRWMLRSTKHTVQFTDNINMMDYMLIQNLRASIISEFPEYKEAISFVKKNHKQSFKNFIKLLDKHKNPTLKLNHLIINHIQSYQTRKESSGMDIVYYCGPGRYLNFSNTWNGDSEGLGGSEEAVVNLSEHFVKIGYNVTVYNVCEKQTIVNGVTYKPYYLWLPVNNQDATILWRDPSILDIPINSKVVILDLHDVIDPDWITQERLDKVTNIYCKSKFHKSLLNANCLGKTKVIPNGIISKNFKGQQIRNNNIIMSTSSPDRCITALLNALPIIRKEKGLENTEIHWAYGFKSGITKGGMEANQDPEIKEWVTQTKSKIKETEGFVDLGRISHMEVINLCKTASIYAYGTYFPEIDCISVTKAMAGGVIPVTTNVGALEEKSNYLKDCLKDCLKEKDKGITVNPKMTYESLDYSITGPEFDNWVINIITQLKSDNLIQREQMSKQVLLDFDWINIVNMWINCIN